MKFVVEDLSKIEEVAKSFIDYIPKGRTIAFEGEMGAGKTTFINAVCKVLQVQDETHSPTYSIVNEYLCPKGTLYHIDAYRLNDCQEALDAGLEDYLYPELYTFLEWPSIIEDILPPEVVKVFITLGTDNKRILRLDGQAQGYKNGFR